MPCSQQLMAALQLTISGRMPWPSNSFKACCQRLHLSHAVVAAFRLMVLGRMLAASIAKNKLEAC